MNFKEKTNLLKLPFVYLKNKLFPQKTYAQHNEDIVIQEVIGEIKRFIDIGTNDGMACSNTFLFAIKGANGLCFEPVSQTFYRLSWLYLLNGKIKCIKEGISNIHKEIIIKDEDLLSYIPDTQDPWGQENLSKYMSNKNKFEKINVKPLNYWLEYYPEFQKSDFVSLDIEGHELCALQGIDFSIFQTKCFIIETMGRSHHNYEAIVQLLNENNYQPLLMNKLNTFWFFKGLVSKEKLKEVSNKFSDYTVL